MGRCFIGSSVNNFLLGKKISTSKGIYMTNSQILCYAIVFPVVGVFFLRHAWLILVKKQIILEPMEQLMLQLLRRTRGARAARFRETELKQPERIQLYGFSALIAGIGSLAIGILALILFF